MPEEWKETIIVPVDRKGIGDRCENYIRKFSLRDCGEYNFGKN